MARTEEFEYESLQDVDAIVGYLNALKEGLEEGRVVLGSNGKELVLSPAGLLRLGVEAKRRKNRSQLVLKVSWREDQPQPTEENPLRITAGEDE
jgi:amphi-Trp domain-containing protein